MAVMIQVEVFWVVTWKKCVDGKKKTEHQKTSCVQQAPMHSTGKSERCFYQLDFGKPSTYTIV
jgi:hypothetical protein